MPTWHKHFIDQRSGTHVPKVLATTGPILTVEISLPQPLVELLSGQNHPLPAPSTGLALIDTGATRTCVDEDILTGLGVNPIGLVSLGTAAGPVERLLYPAKLDFSEFRFLVELGSVVGVSLRDNTIAGTPLIALLGRDILSFCQFVYAGTGSYFSLSV